MLQYFGEVELPMGVVYCTATVTDVSQVMSTWSPTLSFSSPVGSTTRRLYFHPFGPVNVIDDAFLSIPVMVAVITLSWDAVPPGRSPCPAVVVPVLGGFYRRCCDACGKRYSLKRPFTEQIARHERKIAPGVVPIVGALPQRCRHPGAAFGPESPSCGKQLGRDRLDPPFARPQRLQKPFYSLARLEPRREGLKLQLPFGRSLVRSQGRRLIRPLWRQVRD